MAARSASTCTPSMLVRRVSPNSGCTRWMLWRETPFFSDRERAALAWTEAVTLISHSHAPDDVYDEVKKQFSEKEIVDLTFVIGTINLWNRLAISLRAVPGHYKPAKAAAS